MKETSLALGLFDGVHLGHRRVLGAALRGRDDGLIPGVFTFEASCAARKGTGGYLYDDALRADILREECGMEYICSMPFREISDMSGEEFAGRLLCDGLRARHICCGRDFRFGAGAACGVGELAGFGRRFGFTVEVVEDVRLDGQIVSSSAVRSLLLAGKPGEAGALLGAPYRICREVVHGAALGRTIGFPTLNQAFADGQLVPRFGVYAARALAGDTWYPALTNIGRKPTVDYTGAPLAETYLDGFSGDLYGRTVEVQLLAFLRPEQKFRDLAALTAQMHRDLAACREFSDTCHTTDTYA